MWYFKFSNQKRYNMERISNTQMKSKVLSRMEYDLKSLVKNAHLFDALDKANLDHYDQIMSLDSLIDDLAKCLVRCRKVNGDAV